MSRDPRKERDFRDLLPYIIGLVTALLIVGGVAFTPLAQRAQRFSYIITKKLLVLNDTELRGDFTQAGDNTITGDLVVTGDTTLGDSATADTLTVTGNTTIAGARDAATGYDYFTTIEGDFTGAGTGAKTYGLYIDVERTVANTHGNIDEAAAKLRYKTSATSRTAGIVANGIDVEAKIDDDHYAGTVRGAQITAVGDAGSTADTVIGLRVHAEMSGDATTTLQVADFELNRKDATDPTYMWGLNIRNTSSAGGGAGTAIRLESSYGAGGSSANADWVYGLDMSPADIVTADIRLSNGETIDNVTDTAVVIGGFIAADIAATLDITTGSIITPTATYQALTVEGGGPATTDATWAIADGPIEGALLILVNEDAQDIVIKDGGNTKLSGDLTLTGGAQDTITLIWDGSDWVGISVIDN